MNPKYYIGTAGWSYNDWVPAFYPKKQTGGFDWLQFYASYFNCVEVNATYYAFLNPKIVTGWIDKLKDVADFCFTIKLHQDFTHNKNYDRQKINAVYYNLDLLKKAERLGGLLIQFPYSYSFNDASVNYMKKLNEVFNQYKRFIEVRHKSWMNEKVFELFNKMDAAFCTIDQPLIGQAISFEPVITNDTAYIRFHGRNEEAWKKSIKNFGRKQSYDEQNERYKYLYSPGELLEIEQKIKSVQQKVKEVYVIMNNHPQGDAAANAFEMIHYLENKEKVEMPGTIVKAFPRLMKLAKNN